VQSLAPTLRDFEGAYFFMDTFDHRCRREAGRSDHRLDEGLQLGELIPKGID
jgi:hypothetical protein